MDEDSMSESKANSVKSTRASSAMDLESLQTDANKNDGPADDNVSEQSLQIIIPSYRLVEYSY